MKNFNTNTNNHDEWITPTYIVDALGVFDLDPCAPIEPPHKLAEKTYSKLDDGLKKEWEGRVWLNPPYGRATFTWLAKLAEHKNGIALIFARTETKGFHEEIWKKADSVFFFKGRLSFLYVTGEKASTANAPSCLVSYSTQDTASIEKAVAENRIKGKLVKL